MIDDKTERLHALDAVRGFALLAGIVLHATMSFLPGPPGVAMWIVMDSHRSLTLAVLFHVLHIFRMTTFFMIAGFFAHLTFHRRGTHAFVRDRLKRIGIPLLVGWPILFAAILAVSIWGALVTAHGKPLPPPPPYHFPAFPLTHLWFLYLLLGLYAATLGVRAVVVRFDPKGRLRRLVDAIVGRLARSQMAPLLLAAPASIALCLTPNWLMWFGIPTPDSSLVPNAPASIAFGTAFAFGWLVHRQPGLMETWRRHWPVNLALAMAFTAIGFRISGLAPLLVPAGNGWPTWLYAACYMLAAWTWTFAAIGMALQFLSGESPVRRYIADASYWLYLIHLPIVMVLQVAFARLDWPAPMKFLAILVIALPLMLASYQVLVRYSFIGAVLNGRRQPRQALEPELPLTVDSSSHALMRKVTS